MQSPGSNRYLNFKFHRQKGMTFFWFGIILIEQIFTVFVRYTEQDTGQRQELQQL